MMTRTYHSGLLGLLLAALTFLTLNPAVQAATSVSQFGITWTFDRDYPTGQFANGDYWVVGPVTITSITPRSTTSGGVTIHGSMINPAPNTAHGYDSRIRSNTFSATKNVARVFPLKVAAGSSLVSAESYTSLASGDNPQIKTFAILTVLASPAPAGSFRPPPPGTNKSLPWNKSQLNYAKLRSLSRPASTPSLSTVEARFARPWLEHRTNWAGRYLHAGANQPTYGRDLAHALAEGLLSLQLNYTNAQKERLLIRLVQYGIDVYGSARAGASWGADGGHNLGRKMPLLLAGTMLGDASILAYANGGQKTIFQEDQQTWYVLSSDVGRTLYTADGRPREKYILSDVGVPEWGEKHRSDPTKDGRNWNAYYRTVAGAPTTGHVLTAQLMGLKSAWNWPATFDYYDRYFGIEGKNAGGSPNQIQTFVADMWKAYRNTGSNFTVDNTTTTSIWQSTAFTSQSGTFTCAFDMVASKTPMDGITGLSSGVPSQISHLVAAVRFNSAGAIDVLNGSSFGAAATLKYTAGLKYRVVMSVDFSRKLYSVQVTPSGGTAVTLASNYAFRSTSATKLDRVGFMATTGAHSVSNVAVQPVGTTSSTPSTTGSTSTGTAVIRVNAGGAAYTDPSGQRWLADTGYVGGVSATNSSSIADTTLDPLYRSERYTASTSTPLVYRFAVTNGDYVVKLHFAETWASAFKTGGRVFHVRAEGATVVSKLDIFSRVGSNRALVLSVPARVSDGKLTLEFVRSIQNPKICAIEVFKAQ